MKLKEHRFNKTEISPFLRKSNKIQSPCLSIFYLEKQQVPNYAFIVPKRMGSATTRNKLRRQLKEAFYKTQGRLNKNLSLIIMANEKIKNANFNLISNMLLLSLKKRDLINEKNMFNTN